MVPGIGELSVTVTAIDPSAGPLHDVSVVGVKHDNRIFARI